MGMLNDIVQPTSSKRLGCPWTHLLLNGVVFDSSEPTLMSACDTQAMPISGRTLNWPRPLKLVAVGERPIAFFALLSIIPQHSNPSNDRNMTQ